MTSKILSLSLATIALAGALVGCDRFINTSAIKDETAASSMIRFSLNYANDPKKNDYFLVFATDSTATNLGFCVDGAASACTDTAKKCVTDVNNCDTTSYHPLQLLTSHTDGTKYWRSRCGNNASGAYTCETAVLDDGSHAIGVLRVIATDSNGAAVTRGIRSIQIKNTASTSAAPPPPSTTTTSPTPTPTATPTTTPSSTGGVGNNPTNSGSGNNNGNSNNGGDPNAGGGDPNAGGGDPNAGGGGGGGYG